MLLKTLLMIWGGLLGILILTFLAHQLTERRWLTALSKSDAAEARILSNFAQAKRMMIGKLPGSSIAVSGLILSIVAVAAYLQSALLGFCGIDRGFLVSVFSIAVSGMALFFSSSRERALTISMLKLLEGNLDGNERDWRDAIARMGPPDRGNLMMSKAWGFLSLLTALNLTYLNFQTAFLYQGL
ncbi:MAG: hypothetical protein ABIJ61_14440 [bacterium]